MIEIGSGIWIIISVLAGIVVLIGLAVAIKRRREGAPQETDYRAFYIMGISFLPLGIVLMVTTENPGMLGLTALGVVYMAIGLSNRDKWKDTKKPKPSKPKTSKRKKPSRRKR